jgi:ABC-type antimicrobial peptide transport system permease subunit
LLGLFLAALGIYGVTAYAVAQRTQEIGVRIALGAAMRDVMWMILGSGLRLALVGAVIGVAGAVALGRVLASVAPELGMPQPLITVLAAAALIAVSLAASFLSARRATKVDPIIALRAE